MTHNDSTKHTVRQKASFPTRHPCRVPPHNLGPLTVFQVLRVGIIAFPSAVAVDPITYGAGGVPIGFLGLVIGCEGPYVFTDTDESRVFDGA
jgi:hypothetical protein